MKSTSEIGHKDLKEAIETFVTFKESSQDHILERTAVVPEKRIEEISNQYKVHEEMAKVLHVLEFESNIPINLSVVYYQLEMDRLREAKYELPEIYTFIIRFSIEEGFWIKYFYGEFKEQLLQKSSKLLNLDRSLFGDLEAEKEDSALYILERDFICREFIRPILHTWINEHQRSNYLDALRSIIGMIKAKPKYIDDVTIDTLCQNLYSKMESIKGILSELDSKGWAHKAIACFETTFEELKECKETKSKLTWKITAELLLENLLSSKVINTKQKIDASANNSKIHEQYPVGIVDRITTKKDSPKDELEYYLVKLVNLEPEKRLELMRDKIKELFDKAIIADHQKPTKFAKDFLERILRILSFGDKERNKQLKQFDSKLMFRLSPMGTEKFQNMTVDEKVLDLIYDHVLELISKTKLLENLTIVKTEQPAEQETTAATMNDTVDEHETEDSNEWDIQEATDKEIWILVRDSYLKELFEISDELKAAANVLKKLSLQLGLLLTENEAIAVINKELEKMNIKIGTGNKEEIDKTICKVVFAQLKEQRKYQTKI